MSSLTHLIELNSIACEQGRKYSKKREPYEKLIEGRGQHFFGIAGPRGVGKTVLLRQIADSVKDAFYLSVDTLTYDDEDLFGLVQKLKRDLKVRLFLLDEVHFHREFDAVLKKIYDFLDVQVIFTSSVSLAMFASTHDLSRRILLIQLLPFSFREYVYFSANRTLPQLTIEDIHKRRWLRGHMECAPLFKDYLVGGLMPYSLDEPEVLPLLENILTKTLMSDLPKVAKIAINEIEDIQKMLRFIGRSSVDGISFSSISRNVGITKYKAEAYAKLLTRAFVLQIVYPAGANVLKEPKVLMSVPYRLLYRDYDDAIGGLREDFFAEMMRANGCEFQYLKTTRGAKTPDFFIRLEKEELVVEIGGKGKGRSQFKGITTHEKLILTQSISTDGLKRPLFLLGFIA